MWTVYFRSDPGFPFNDTTTCGGFRWGIWCLEANHRAPFTHVFLPEILKKTQKTGTLREGFGSSSTGVRREAPCGVSEFGDSCTRKQLQRLFALGPETIILPLFNFSTCRRWRPQSFSRCEVPGATGHRQPGYNIGFMLILIWATWWGALESLWERRSLHSKPTFLSLLHLKLGADGNCGLIKTYKSVICSASTVTF